ncbi:MAG: hypothetical protein KAT77_03250 [Nanoarchaeota archaeon]|nr:hypothetical protein [Nanoarchaeota archaeon]
MSYTGNCSYSLAGPNSSSCGYSDLESMAYHTSLSQSPNVNYFAEAIQPETHFYIPKQEQVQMYNNSNQVLYQIKKTQPTNIEYSFIPDNFLKPGWRKRFIGDAEQIQEEIQEAFLKTTEKEFPPDIQITICEPNQFKKIISQPGVRGISFNRKESGQTSEIFVLNDDLASVMLTIGHELGHVISKPLKDKRLEEAKAFAFSKAWMKTIKQHNIANLRSAITLENPANNGIHDIAHQFVNKFKDKNPLELYWEIVGGKHAIYV